MANQPTALNQGTTSDDNSNRRLYNTYQDLNLPKKTAYHLPTTPEFLFPEESIAQRRSWGENIIYYTAIGYLVGASAGAARGFGSGVESIEPTDTLKLKINRILNSSGHTARHFGTRCGVAGCMYAGVKSGMVVARDADDVFNSIVAGLYTVALCKKEVAGSRSAAVTGAICSVAVGLAVAERLLGSRLPGNRQ